MKIRCRKDQEYRSLHGELVQEETICPREQNHFARQKNRSDGFDNTFLKQVNFPVAAAHTDQRYCDYPDKVWTDQSDEEQQDKKIGELEAECASLEKRVAALALALDKKKEALGETRIALHVLLNKRDEGAQQVQERILFNIEKFVTPYLQKLQMDCADESQKVFLGIIQSNLEQITSSFSYTNKDNLSKLTPTQIQVMDLIKYGHTTKEIAEFLNLSPSTVACHRQAIRKRLSLNNRKINLYAALSAQTEESEDCK